MYEYDTSGGFCRLLLTPSALRLHVVVVHCGYCDESDVGVTTTVSVHSGISAQGVNRYILEDSSCIDRLPEPLAALFSSSFFFGVCHHVFEVSLC